MEIPEETKDVDLWGSCLQRAKDFPVDERLSFDYKCWPVKF